MTTIAQVPAGYKPTGAVEGDDTTHLVRVDGERSKGWQLRLPKWHPMGPATRLFSDKQYHGPIGAYAAAKAARDVYFRGYPLLPSAYVSNRRTTSGISGVNLNFASHLKGASAFSWVACWMENGKQKKLRFSIAMYDFDTALDLAIAMRESKAGVVVPPEARAQAASLRVQVDNWINHGISPDLTPVTELSPVGLREKNSLSVDAVPEAAPVATKEEVREAKAAQRKERKPAAPRVAAPAQEAHAAGVVNEHQAQAEAMAA